MFVYEVFYFVELFLLFSVCCVDVCCFWSVCLLCCRPMLIEMSILLCVYFQQFDWSCIVWYDLWFILIF